MEHSHILKKKKKKLLTNSVMNKKMPTLEQIQQKNFRKLIVLMKFYPILNLKRNMICLEKEG